MAGFTPGAEHAWIAAKAGEWDAECIMFHGTTPIPYKATDSAVMMGPFWLRGLFSADMMGMPYSGLLLLGFDPLMGKFVSTWCDSIGPTMTAFEGTLDAATDTLESRGVGMGPAGPATKYRATEVRHSPDSHTFTMYYEGPTGEVKVLEYKYTRKK